MNVCILIRGGEINRVGSHSLFLAFMLFFHIYKHCQPFNVCHKLIGKHSGALRLQGSPFARHMHVRYIEGAVGMNMNSCLSSYVPSLPLCTVCCDLPLANKRSGLL